MSKTGETWQPSDAQVQCLADAIDAELYQQIKAALTAREGMMGLKRSAGNMYPWVSHTHSHLVGKCPHECSYCYVQAMERRFHTGRYVGPLALDEAEFNVKYGTGKTIFIEHMNDLFAKDVPDEWIHRVLTHCAGYLDNTYVFQSKNPGRMARMLLPAAGYLKFMLGTTIETTALVTGHAPSPDQRAEALAAIRILHPDANLFVTVEPIQTVDVPVMLRWFEIIRPNFINIGADSKGTGLVEPTADEVRALITGIQTLGLEIRQKHNLDRLLGEGQWKR